MMKQYSKQLFFALFTVGLMLVNTNDFLIAWCEYDLELVRNAHQWWRLLTGHFTHWGTSHFIWDFILFIFLIWMCLRNKVECLALHCVCAAVLISLFLPWVEPDIIRYRGLSGLDSMLFALLCCAQIKATAQGGRRQKTIAVLMLGGFMIKSGAEIVLGSPIFVENSNFINLPSVHLIGAVAGATTFWIFPLSFNEDVLLTD